MRQTTPLTGILATALLSVTAGTVSDANSRDSSVEQRLIAATSFGQSVAVDGNTAVVGAPGGLVAGAPNPTRTSIGAAYVFTQSGDTWTETAKLVATDGAPSDDFGQSVVLAGDTLVVGASLADVDGNVDQGAAYVFTRANGTWSQTAKLTPSDGAANGLFAASMAFDGDTLVIGPYVFTRGDDGTWTEAVKLTPADGRAVGWAVALDGDTLVLGVSANFDQGSAYVFTRSGDTWTEAAKLVASDGRAGDSFGSSVTVAGDTVVVGAFQVGAAYVFAKTGDTWTEMAKLTPSDGAAQVEFGQSVALVNQTLVVGARDVTYVFTGAGDTWSEMATLTAGAGGGALGQPPNRVAFDGETLIVGATLAAESRGAAYVFTGAGDTWTETATLTLPFQQHFAEGATGFFQTDVGLFNPSDTDAADVLVTLNPEASGEAVEVPVTLEPRQRHTLDVNDAMGVREDGVSIHVESDHPVVATRQMRWDAAQTYGSTLETGAPETAATWYFAEGATYFTNLFYLLANPNDAEAHVTIRYVRGSGDPITQDVVVPAQGRRTVWANEVPGLEFAEVAAVISADRPIVAERAMYFGERFDAGTTSMGTTALSQDWFFAEGETSFFDTFLVLGNPGDAAAEVRVTYQSPAGVPGGEPGGGLAKTYEVPAGSRRTILVDQEDPQLASTAVAMRVSSTTPIVAERAMWWGPTPASWYEGHVTLGATETGYEWVIGEGASGGPDAEDTYVLVANASLERGPVRLTVVQDDGTTAEQTFHFESLQRQTFRIRDHFPALENQRFSILVESVGLGEDFIPTTVEYSRYQSTEGRFGNGGGSALATVIPYP